MIAKIFPVRACENEKGMATFAAPRFAVVSEDFPDFEIGTVVYGGGDLPYTTDSAGKRWDVLGLGQTTRAAMEDAAVAVGGGQ